MPPAIKLQCLPVAWLPGGLVELEVTGRAHIRLAGKMLQSMQPSQTAHYECLRYLLPPCSGARGQQPGCQPCPPAGRLPARQRPAAVPPPGPGALPLAPGAAHPHKVGGQRRRRRRRIPAGIAVRLLLLLLCGQAGWLGAQSVCSQVCFIPLECCAVLHSAGGGVSGARAAGGCRHRREDKRASWSTAGKPAAGRPGGVRWRSLGQL